MVVTGKTNKVLSAQLLSLDDSVIEYKGSINTETLLLPLPMGVQDASTEILLCPSTETLRSLRIDPSARNLTVKEDTGASHKFLITARIMVETPLYTTDGTKEISDGETERSGRLLT